jgi:hypothetical protein
MSASSEDILNVTDDYYYYYYYYYQWGETESLGIAATTGLVPAPDDR